jgi:DNA-binding transcriptional MocR family regulator
MMPRTIAVLFLTILARQETMDLEELAAAIDDRSARGIAAALGHLVRTGALAPTDRLPTVRQVAARLGVSPSTVSEAWQALARAGAIETRGKSGTFVLGEAAAHGPARYQRITQGPGVYQLDLSSGTPDVALLPDLARLAPQVVGAAPTTNYLDDPVDPALGEVLRRRWPFPPERLTVVDGCLDAIARVMAELVRFGDRVLVENPTFPPVLDLLGDLGAQVTAIELDEHGPVPASVAAGLEREPVALFFQPRCQNPAGVALTAERGAELAALLRGTDVVVVEDDHAGEVSASPLVSLGRWLPDRTVHIAGFSKSHGPDLRLAGVGGAAEPVDAVVSRRRLGPGWSSRILQRLLATLLVDPATAEGVARARDAYAERRAALAGALAERGVPTGGSDGIYLWVPVLDESTALVYLASRGIGASPGTPFEAAPLPTAHIRLTSGLVSSGVDELADEVTAASQGPPAAPRR